MLRRREFAEEVLQDAFVNIWRFASEYRSGVSTPMVWMRVIVRNRTLDYMRQRQPFASMEIEWNDILDEVLAADVLDPYELAVLSERTWQLGTCMSQLDANQRRALELAYFNDFSHREVAREMRAPLGTVKAWIRRATDTLRISLAILETASPLTAAGQLAEEKSTATSL